MKRSVFISFFLLISQQVVPAQNYYMQYTHDTLGNRTNRVRGILTKEMESEGVSADTVLQNIMPPSDTVLAFKDDKATDESGSVKHGSLIKTRAEKEAYLREMMARTAALEPIMSQGEPSRSINDYDVGAIPLQYGVSPTGARTYSIPIQTATDIKYAPSLAMVYNSQGGYGYGGYGWDLAGLSEIRLTIRCLYYDDMIQAADAADTSAVFMLDGVRLVRNDDSATSANYPLVTATGHILATPVKNASGYVRYFNVLYPNGVRATYGSTSLNLNSNMLSYPMVESINLDGDKIEYVYSFDSTDGSCYLTGVRYGFDSLGNPAGEIQWLDTWDQYYQYYAGNKLYRKPRIDNLLSRIDDETAFYYEFRYSWSAGTPLLTSVAVSNSDGNYLPPLAFTYGPEQAHSGPDSLKVGNNILLVDNYGYNGLYYKRGKIARGNYNDGILLYPICSNYHKLGHKYVSMYDYIQQSVPILSAPSVADVTNLDDQISFSSGFQTIEPVDVDGNGVDDIVRVNCGTTVIAGTLYNFTVYNYDPEESSYASRSFVVKLSGYITRSGEYSPYRRAYYWGDFKGNGKTEMLAISYSTNGDGQDYSMPQTCYFSLVDLDRAILLSEQSLFSFPYGSDKTVFCVDIDGDGITELCHATSNGTDVYKLGTNNLFSICKTIPALTDSVMDSSETYLSDINADGYIDIIKYATGSNQWQLFTNTGVGFVYENIVLDYKDNGDTFFFIDINRDGYPDAIKVNASSFGYYLNKDGASFDYYRPANSTLTDVTGILPGNVVDYTSMSSFIKVDGQYIKEYVFTSFAPESRQLKQSKDSYGAIVRNTYSYLPQSSHCWTDNPSNAEDGFQYRVLPIYVLSGAKGMLSQENNSQVFLQDSYFWYDGVVNTKGLGFCGFSKTRKVLYLDTIPINDVSCYNPMKAGILTSQNQYFSMDSAHPFFTADYTWDDHSTTYGKLSPRLTRAVSTDITSGVITTTSYQYDVLDYPEKITTSTSTTELGSSILTVDNRVYCHSNSPYRYVLGNISMQTILSDRDHDLSSLAGKRVRYNYDQAFRPLSTKHYLVKATMFGRSDHYNYTQYLVSKDSLTYDSHGNVLTEESAPYDATEYTGDTYTYDSSGRHLTSSTNALGQTTTYSNFDKYGNAMTVTDHRNRVRTNSFDSWGKQTKTVYADGTVDSTALAWGGQGVYTVTRTVTGKPSTIVHYDALSREIRSGNRRFNGQWQYTDTEYNQRGMVYRSSLPFRGASASYWNTSTYDSYGRRTKITEASGRITQWSYSGTSVTEAKDGITVTRTTNAAGDLVSVEDAAGTITYTLWDNGQPSSITAPGNVTTSFTYDNYGRRTSIVDPSAGTRSTSYLYNTDGSTVTTETNALGSIATSVDKYGRVTGVTRTGTGAFNTTYSYDTYGRLSAVSSTNSTGEEYTYDAYDRVATEKETVPDGKWLQKSYTYGAGSNVASIAYTSQSGYITTENYSYSNGHNNVVVIAGGTIVLSKTAENDLGQPTAAISGSVSRTYDYTAYGFPTKRKLTAGGNTIQDLRTTFNPQTGNLTNRSNAANSSSTEYFYYDALGRLNYDSQGPSAYDIKGNAIYRSGIGTMTYPNASHPYRIERLNASSSSVTRPNPQTATYTAYDRPATLAENYLTASFTYNADYQRVKMQTTVQGNIVQKKYYFGGRYEREENSSGTVTAERLFVGGDAYSAPMVLQRTSSSGSWTPYVIGRDYLGSITNITTTSGTSVATYSYDPWGRMRDPQSLTPYSSTSQPSLLLGRGYCGHEHLSNYGLINMNARLYDPVLGRFLSPDPYVQSPDFSQNFNRYAYALNNPLKYTDESGEFLGTYFTATWRLPHAILHGIIFPLMALPFDRETSKEIFNEAWSDYGKKVSNAFKIDKGLFQTEEHLSVGEKILTVYSRFTWERKNTLYGNVFSHIRNNFLDVDVDYYHGATVISQSKNKGWGITLGSYINMNNHDEKTLRHEYGHTKQSQYLGPLYLKIVGLPSLVGCVVDVNHEHRNEWYEVWANNISYNYHDEYDLKDKYGNFVRDSWDRTRHPLDFKPDWYFYATIACYPMFLLDNNPFNLINVFF